MRALITTLTLGLAGLLAAPALAEVEVIDLEGRKLRGELSAIDAKAGTLTLQIDHKPRLLVLGELVEIINRSRGAAPEVEAELELRSGELIRGTLEKPRELRVAVVSALGRIEIDLDRETPPRWLRFLGPGIRHPAPEEGHGAQTDALYKRDGTLLTNGDVDGFEGDKVTVINKDLGTLTRPLREVGAIRFASDAAPPAAAPGLRAMVEGAGGSVLIGTLEGIEGGLVRMLSVRGTEHQVPLSGISKISLSGGKFDYVSDLIPVKIKEIPHVFDPPVELKPPFTKTHRPRNYYVDRAYPGDAPLRLGGSAHRKGLGLHSWVAVTYALDGKYRRFTATVGIDDGVDALPGDVNERGSVIFRVLVDGKEKAHYPAKGFLAGGAAPVEVRVEVAGAKRMTLVVDYAANPGPPDYADTHIRDRVALVAPRLIK